MVAKWEYFISQSNSAGRLPSSYILIAINTSSECGVVVNWFSMYCQTHEAVGSTLTTCYAALLCVLQFDTGVTYLICGDSPPQSIMEYSHVI